jgi:hypothetical protein
MKLKSICKEIYAKKGVLRSAPLKTPFSGSLLKTIGRKRISGGEGFLRGQPPSNSPFSKASQASGTPVSGT